MREGFREILRDPALLLIEIAWRWSFGLLVILVFSASMLVVLGSISVDSERLEFLARLNPGQSAKIIADSLRLIAHQLLRIGVSATLVLAFCWTCMSALGRYATLRRPAFNRTPQIASLVAIHATRAASSIGATACWIALAIVAGRMASAGRSDALPNPSMVLRVLGPALVLLLGVWGLANWYLSLAPLFSASDWQRPICAAWNFVRFNRDRILEISIAIGILRAVLFLAAFLLSFAIAAIVTNPRVLLADLVAISLLYFLTADFIYVARLAAYGKLASEAMARKISGTARAQHVGDTSQERTALNTLSLPAQSRSDPTQTEF